MVNAPEVLADTVPISDAISDMLVTTIIIGKWNFGQIVPTSKA